MRSPCLLALFLAAPAMAQIPGGDVWLHIETGRVVTGLISEDGTTTTPGVRVFFADLGFDVPNFTAEPGWRALDGSFTPGSHLSFTINRALRKWSGSDFSVLPSESMTLEFGVSAATTPASDLLTPGFSLTMDPDGGLHDHPDYTLNTPASNGIYLLDISFGSSMPGIAPSERAWLLFAQNADEPTSEAAYAWATANVPAPGALPLMIAAAASAALRRR